jgi:hypothetical protein
MSDDAHDEFRPDDELFFAAGHRPDPGPRASCACADLPHAGGINEAADDSMEVESR